MLSRSMQRAGIKQFSSQIHESQSIFFLTLNVMDFSSSNLFFFSMTPNPTYNYLWRKTSAACREYDDSAIEFITYKHKVEAEIH